MTQVRSDEGFSISSIETSLSTIGPSLGPGPVTASDLIKDNNMEVKIASWSSSKAIITDRNINLLELQSNQTPNDDHNKPLQVQVERMGIWPFQFCRLSNQCLVKIIKTIQIQLYENKYTGVI